MAGTLNPIVQNTILIVDDTPDNLVLLSNMLKDNYKIKVANTGEKALKIVESEKVPDLILLDIMMPGMDGFAVCRKLKSMAQAKDIPVIFISALTDINDIIMAFEAGGFDYITKPFQLAEVMARVNIHMELKKAKNELQNLLSNTLSGSIRILMDLLTVSKPDLVERSNMIRGYAQKLINTILVNSGEKWIIDLAIMLSHIGCITLSEEITRKKYSESGLTDEEEKLFCQHPYAGADMIANIPRLEKVSDIIKNQLIHPAMLNYDQTDIVFVGVAILNLLLEYDLRITRGMEPVEAIKAMKNELPVYPFGLLNQLEEMVTIEIEGKRKTLRLDALQPDMILKENLLSKANKILLPEGTVLTSGLIQLIDRFFKMGNCSKSQIDVAVRE